MMRDNPSMVEMQRQIEEGRRDARRQVLMRRVLDGLRETARAVPVRVEDAEAPMMVEFTNKSAEFIAPLVEAVEILEAVIFASDGCMGHKGCAHSMEPWQRARALLEGKWRAESDPEAPRWPAR